MMELTINNVVYNFNFGMGFLRKINALDKRTESGITKEIGFRLKLAGLLDGDCEDLETILDCANAGQEKRVTRQLLDEYIEDPSTDIEALFETVKDFLSQSNCTRRQTEEVTKMAKEAEEIKEAERRRKMEELARA